MMNTIEKQPAMTMRFNLESVHPSWHACLQKALETLDPVYHRELLRSDEWLPSAEHIFNAFSLPLDQVNYILFGESPYPRKESANGYAFWDAAVTQLWSETGLSKPVNRATSLRNIIKMLLIAEGLLDPNHTTQPDIAKINKSHLVQTNEEFFTNFIKQGFLLLNATLVLQPGKVKQDARAWRPFLKKVVDYLVAKNPSVQLILFGNIAYEIDQLIGYPKLKKLYAEHPYNISYISNQEVIEFFRPFHLLRRPTA